MSNLPHTRNSAAGRNMYEPIVASQFECYLLPPRGVNGNVAILTEHVMSVEGLFVENTEGQIEQKYQTATRSYDTNDGNTPIDFTINFSLNLNDSSQNYVYKILRDWKRKQRNPLTGERGLKKNYVGQVVVVKYNRDGTIFWRRTANQVFINGSLADLTNDYGSSEPQTLSVQFRSDWVDEDEL